MCIAIVGYVKFNILIVFKEFYCVLIPSSGFGPRLVPIRWLLIITSRRRVPLFVYRIF